MADSDPPDAAAGDARMLLRSIDFEFILCMEITTPIFNETAIASASLQKKDLDLTTSYTIVEGVIQRVKAMRKDEEFKVLFSKAKGNSEAAGIEVPDEIPGQARRRKVPQKYKYSTKSATEDYQAQDLEEHYRGKVFFTFLDTLSQELHRRFKGKDETPTGLILSGLHCLTIPSHWKGMTNDRVARSVKDVCRFYDVEEENVVTELKVFHSSYALPPSNSESATVQEDVLDAGLPVHGATD
ncbi:unnamed protein product, partial [Pleuronectes platessa]